jgi:hypothetical protein
VGQAATLPFFLSGFVLLRRDKRAPSWRIFELFSFILLNFAFFAHPHFQRSFQSEAQHLLKIIIFFQKIFNAGRTWT